MTGVTLTTFTTPLLSVSPSTLQTDILTFAAMTIQQSLQLFKSQFHVTYEYKFR